MNPNIEALIQQVVIACLRVTTAGKHHAFFGYSAHVGAISVRVLPASTLYAEGHPSTPVFTREVRLTQPTAQADLESLYSNLRLLDTKVAA